jgi:NAD(P)H-dependent nitrite reductase small subunit
LKERWVAVGRIEDFPKDGGAAVKVGKVQIAVFHFTSRGQWYACQNMCPHKNAFVLSRGILGTAGDEPKVACPLHKRPFSLETGKCQSGEDYSVKVFPVKVIEGEVHVELPPQAQLDALLATELHCITACRAAPSELCATAP